jgi:hypothetical protein
MNTSAYFDAPHLKWDIPGTQWALVYLFIALASSLALWGSSVFAVPPELRHLPRVSVLKLVWSYAKAEPDDVRIRRLILPFVKDGEDIVLVWIFGRWIIHIINDEVPEP